MTFKNAVCLGFKQPCDSFPSHSVAPTSPFLRRDVVCTFHVWTGYPLSSTGCIIPADPRRGSQHVARGRSPRKSPLRCAKILDQQIREKHHEDSEPKTLQQ